MAYKRQGSYSWKTPWAFEDFLTMRRTLTERYVYKKLGMLEKHSMWKKPYRRGFKGGSHKVGELEYKPPGVRPPGGGGGGCPPHCGRPPPPPIGGCTRFAALPTMIDCDGGIGTISAICAQGRLTGRVLSDPTGGRLSVGIGTSTHLRIYLAPGGTSEEKFNRAVVLVSDGVTAMPVDVWIITTTGI
ncbi:MAG: hypothetical protein ACXABY_32705 [Candidatus Thorarchaeota archaeon]|jgi:hypothetical protein